MKEQNLKDMIDTCYLMCEQLAQTNTGIKSSMSLKDMQRIEFLKMYLKGLKRAIDEGYPIFGYIYWSILDNMEWAEGYNPRFGLIYVDYRTLERTRKDSSYWYADVIRRNGPA